MQRIKFGAAALVAFVLLAARPATSQVIVSPTGGVINSGGPGAGALADTWNHNGLLTGFTSGVTLFDPYIGGNPIHTLIFSGNEWFSNSGISSASVTYNMGAIGIFDRLALWNEDASGIGILNLFYSTDNVTFFSLASGLAPTNNAYSVDYPADIFSFGATSFQYIRFDMDRCPQSGASYNGCAIGEVAFRTAGTVVPEPASMTLLATGLVGMIGAGMRRRKKA